MPQGDEEIRRVDIPMNEAVAGGRVQPIRNLKGEVEQRVNV
jgi:hypothetical protein